MVCLPFPVMGGLCHCFTHIISVTIVIFFPHCFTHSIYLYIHVTIVTFLSFFLSFSLSLSPYIYIYIYVVLLFLWTMLGSHGALLRPAAPQVQPRHQTRVGEAELRSPVDARIFLDNLGRGQSPCWRNSERPVVSKASSCENPRHGAMGFPKSWGYLQIMTSIFV